MPAKKAARKRTKKATQRIPWWHDDDYVEPLMRRGKRLGVLKSAPATVLDDLYTAGNYGYGYGTSSSPWNKRKAWAAYIKAIPDTAPAPVTTKRGPKKKAKKKVKAEPKNNSRAAQPDSLPFDIVINGVVFNA